MSSSNAFEFVSTGAAVDLKTALNNCKSDSPLYTRLADLREECGYLITAMERVTTPFGETIIVILEGQVGDDFFLRVYLPRRFNQVMSDIDIERYNSGFGERLRLVKHSPKPGTKFTPLEFM